MKKFSANLNDTMGKHYLVVELRCENATQAFDMALSMFNRAYPTATLCRFDIEEVEE